MGMAVSEHARNVFINMTRFHIFKSHFPVLILKTEHDLEHFHRIKSFVRLTKLCLSTQTKMSIDQNGSVSYKLTKTGQ